MIDTMTITAGMTHPFGVSPELLLLLNSIGAFEAFQANPVLGNQAIIGGLPFVSGVLHLGVS
jgi:hypothetical protein